MKRKKISKKGMTLIELIIASLMVGIVMIGMSSVDFAIRRSRNNTSDSALTAIETQALMARITREAEEAVGDAANPGIQLITNGFCLQKNEDLNGDPTVADDYSDDTLVCFCRVNNSVYVTRNPAGDQSCDASDEKVGTVACTTETCASYLFSVNSDANLTYLDISITNRPDPTAKEHPLKNPEYSIFTRIYPLALQNRG